MPPPGDVSPGEDIQPRSDHVVHPPLRSVLYVPGDDAGKLARAGSRGADGLILDLEDAVAPGQKESARHTVAEWLAGGGHSGPGQVWVRVNHDDRLAADISAVVTPGVDGICLPKCSSADDLVELDRLLSLAEDARGMARGALAVCAMVESARGLLAAAAIAGAARVSLLQLGEMDLGAELGLDPGPDGRELDCARMTVVVASAAAGIEPPLGAVVSAWRDREEFRRSSEALARMGFFGRACIHPDQVEVANEVFTPSAERVESARRLLAGFDLAVAQGHGVTTDEEGRMVDLAVVRSARRVLAIERYLKLKGRR